MRPKGWYWTSDSGVRSCGRAFWCRPPPFRAKRIVHSTENNFSLLRNFFSYCRLRHRSGAATMSDIVVNYLKLRQLFFACRQFEKNGREQFLALILHLQSWAFSWASVNHPFQTTLWVPFGSNHHFPHLTEDIMTNPFDAIIRARRNRRSHRLWTFKYGL